MKGVIAENDREMLLAAYLVDERGVEPWLQRLHRRGIDKESRA